jgi:hypothetical protein
MTFGCSSLWLIIKNIIRGKVMASPKFGPQWVLWIYVCSWFVHAPKGLQPCTNQLVFGLCRFMWIIDPLIIRSNPCLRALAHPSTFEVLWVKEHTPNACTIFTFKLAFESFKERGGGGLCQTFLKNIWRLDIASEIKLNIYIIRLIYTCMHYCLWWL